MITISITQKVNTINDMVHCLYEIMGRLENSGCRVSYDPDFEILGEEEPEEEDKPECIVFELEQDPQKYYCHSEQDMINFAEMDGRKVDNWHIEISGMPASCLHIEGQTWVGSNIYIDYGK